MTVTGVRRAGERAVILDTSSPPASVAAGIRLLAWQSGLALIDVVPGATTVLVVAIDPTTLGHLMKALPQIVIADPLTTSADTTIDIAVTYDGPDLESVAEATGLSVAEVIRVHAAPIYQAAFTGFAPGFAYLSGLDERLLLPRRSSPRPAVPVGSVAIADTYSAIYPRSSPGGWHLLGSTDAPVFDPDRESPALIAPGARVRFVPTSPDPV